MNQDPSSTPRTAVPAPARPRALLAGVVSALAAALVLSGCTGQGGGPAPTPPPTPIGRLDSAALAIPRIDFCSMVPDQAVRAAVGSDRPRRRSWGDGEPMTVGVGNHRARDLLAEHGCSWSAHGRSDRRAAAWIFARPVNRDYARQVVREATRTPHCRRVKGPRFGTPSLTQRCTLPHPERVRVRHAGLFGGTWLTCQVSADRPPAEVRHLADRWCVAVASALNQNR